MDVKSLSLQMTPFNAIGIDREITPEALEHDEIKADSSTTEDILNLISETGYREPLKVAVLNRRLILLPPYEIYKAYDELTGHDADLLVPCILIACVSHAEILKLATRLSSFQGNEKSHLHRLLNLQLIKEAADSFTEIKSFLGTKANRPNEKRQLQRDLRLIEFPNLLSRVLGIPIPDSGDVKIVRDLEKAKKLDIDMTAKQAEIYLSKLRGDQDAVVVFLSAFDEEKKWIIANFGSPDEDARPFYKRKAFKFHRMLKIAENISLGLGYLPNEEEERSDQKWEVKIAKDSGISSLKESKFSLYDPSPKNLKTLIAVAYNAGELSKSLKGHLSRIRPVLHGQSLKVKGSDLKPSISIHSNHPDLHDLSYIKFVRDNKVLLYCNRQQFLRCLELNPFCFGFDSYRWDSTSNYEKSQAGFEDWWQHEFLTSARKWYSNIPERNPKYSYYVHLKSFLKERATSDENQRTIFFSDFFNDTFSYVLTEMDLASESHRARIEALARNLRELSGSTWRDIDQEIQKKGDVTLTAKQLTEFVKDVVADVKNSLSSNINVQTHKIAEQNSILRDLVFGSESPTKEKEESLIKDLQNFYD
jgi:hypothetical protein